MFLINFSTIPNLLLPTFSEPPCRIGMGDFCVKKEEALLLPLKTIVRGLLGAVAGLVVVAEVVAAGVIVAETLARLQS